MEHRISAGRYKDVKLSESRLKINSLLFCQSVIDSLKKRLPGLELLKTLRPLERHFWPQQHSDLILYGEAEVHALAKTLGEPTQEAVQEFQDSKLQNSLPGKTLLKLQTASLTYLPTSAECERGFSVVNFTDNELRERSLSLLLFVDLNGHIDMWHPTLPQTCTAYMIKYTSSRQQSQLLQKP